MTDKAQLKIGGTTIDVSNLAKVFYPKTGFTKGQIINYYIQVSPFLLPHLKDRHITLKRYPEGVEGLFFYEKECPSHRPRWIDTTKVPRNEGGDINYCLMNSLSALIWAVNLADLELHVFLHRAPKTEQPTAVAFDLDPGAPADILDCCKTALELKKLLEKLKLKSFPKTSGSKGLQIYVPLNYPITYKKTKPFAHAVANQLEQDFPESVVSNMQKTLRKGKVLVDWSQNDTHKTTVCVYSLRAKERPAVSTPVTWEEVETALKKRNAKMLEFQPDDVLKRIEKHGDLFAAVLKLKQKLPSVLHDTPAGQLHSASPVEGAYSIKRLAHFGLKHQFMPEQETIERAREDEREGKAPSTQAGEFVREEFHHLREGKHGARSAKQAIAIGLSKARRAGVKLTPPSRGRSSPKVRRQAERDYEKGHQHQDGHVSSRRSTAMRGALRREGHQAASTQAISRQARNAASHRTSSGRSAAAQKAVRPKGRAGLSAAGRKAGRTRMSNK